MKTPVALIHTSPAAIAPLMQHYTREAPELELTNLLDDGVLRCFAANERDAAEARLTSLIVAARDHYGAKAALVTCSAVTGSEIRSLAEASRIPVVKIDEPMAQAAVRCGRRIGVAVTFAPTAEPTRALLLEAAAEAGREIELIFKVVPEAYRSLLAGNAEDHDARLLEAVDDLAGQGPDCIVLAQVSMARALGPIRARCSVPVLTSLETSLAALRSVI